MITFHDVSKIYEIGGERVAALDHVNFQIDRGEFVSIIGPSGSGKSTMMNIIGCLDVADEGEYILDGQSMDTITSMLSYLLGGIAAISLLVGGIGIMNIMLVSVTERTKEIGIRKAIGAGQGSILLQFLIEALMISLIGCAIGVALSWVIILVASEIAGDVITFTLSPGVVGIAVIFSTAIGVLFGIYPARKAANMHPIDALRYAG